MKLKWAKEKQSWLVDNWMKVIFSDESRIFIDQSNVAKIFVRGHSNETKTKKGEFLKSFMI